MFNVGIFVLTLFLFYFLFLWGFVCLGGKRYGTVSYDDGRIGGGEFSTKESRCAETIILSGIVTRDMPKYSMMSSSLYTYIYTRTYYPNRARRLG